MVYHSSEFWRTRRPLLIRFTAHVSIVALALLTVFSLGIKIPTHPARASAGGLSESDNAFTLNAVAGTGQETGRPSTASGISLHDPDSTLSRLPDPHTAIPKRPRAQVIPHVVQRDETLFDIAAQYDLSPLTIIWSNSKAFGDVPWLIEQGSELAILPVDGVYHTARAGETVAGIAADYGVEIAGVYNEWNDLNWGRQPRTGQRLVVAGGKGAEIAWQLSPRYPAPGPDGHSHGMCDGIVVTGTGGHGWFTYPAGDADVSGWYFRDPRNPSHIGIDYRCKRGEPLYAADSGVVTHAGWYGTYGIAVEIAHGGGFTTRYGHFSSIDVACGDTVYQGEQIGTCGNTGWSSGAHLHFEIRYRNVPQDPQIYLPPFSP